MSTTPANPTPTPLSATEVSLLDGLDDWTYVLEFLQAEFRCSTFAAGADLVATIAQLADETDHLQMLICAIPDLCWSGRRPIRRAESPTLTLSWLAASPAWLATPGR